MNSKLLFNCALAVAALALLAACSSADTDSEDDAASAAAGVPDETPYELTQQFDLSISVTTTALQGTFSRLHKDHSCEGRDISPPVSWEGVPAEAKSLALLFDDPASDELQGLGMWTHWVVYGIPPDVTEIAADQPTSTVLSIGAKLGKNDYGDVHYTSICPTPTLTYTADASRVRAGGNVGFVPPTVAKERPYFFRLYALDKEIDLEPGKSRNALLREIDGHIVAGGVVAVPFKSTRKVLCRVVDRCLSTLQR